jgi:hypothetical protein
MENKGYEKKTYPKLVLNKLKIMGGRTPIYIPLGTWLKKRLHKGFHVCIDEKKTLRSFLVQKNFHVCIDQGRFFRSLLVQGSFQIQRNFHKSLH